MAEKRKSRASSSMTNMQVLECRKEQLRFGDLRRKATTWRNSARIMFKFDRGVTKTTEANSLGDNGNDLHACEPSKSSDPRCGTKPLQKDGGAGKRRSADLSQHKKDKL